MTVQSSQSRVGYAGDGSTLTLAVPFLFYTPSDVVVVQTNSQGVERTLVFGTDYTLSGAGSATGGTIALALPVPNDGSTLNVFLNPALTQLTHYVQGQVFPSSAIETNFDRLTQMVQRVADQVSRSIVKTDGDTAGQLILPPAAVRANTQLAFDGFGNLSLAALSAQAITSTLLAPFLNLSVTPAEAATGVKIFNIGYPPGDARRYGLSATLADNSGAINAAIQVSDAGGPAAYVPSGTWVCTNPIKLLGNASLYGDGQQTNINMVGCDWLQCQPQPTFLGARFIRDLLVTGTNTGSNNGFAVNFTAASGNRIVGVQIQNVTIQNFGVGFNQRGCWYCTFTGCVSFNNFIGYQLVGQNIVTTFVGCFAHRGTITGTGLSKGWYLDTIAGESPQSNHLIGCNTYNFDRNISIEFAFNTYVIGGDHSQARIVCIYILTTIGNTVIRDCWLETWNAAIVPTTGILCDNVIANDYPIIIEGNQIWCDLTNLGAVGVNNGAGHRSTRVKNNRIENFTTAINNASDSFVSSDNIIKACGAAYNSAVNYVPNNVVNSGGSNYICTAPNTNIAPPNAAFWTLTINTLIAHSLNSLNANVKVGDTVNAGLPVVSTALTSPGFSYYDQGTFPATLTGMNGGGTIAGNVSFRANGGSVDLTVSNSAGILGTSAAAAMTLLGLPAYLWPVTDQVCTAQVVDNGVTSLGQALISAATGIITFKKDVAGTAFTPSGSKGLNGGTMSYAYT